MSDTRDLAPPRSLRLGTAFVAVLLFWAAGPPALLPGAEWLVVPGLMAFYAAVTASRRPLLVAYLLGLCHIAVYSWSLRHTVFLGYLAMGPVGGFYYVLMAAWSRGLARRLWAPCAFALAFAGVNWLKGQMPEVPYPHGQPVHALYQWPGLLGAVQWGGEVLGNAVLATLAGALVQTWRAWRVGVPRFPLARRRLAIVAAAGAGLAIVPPLLRGGPGEAPQVDVAAVEPGLPPMYQFDDVNWPELFRTRLWRPTLAVAGRGVADPPDLVLWPESCHPGVVTLAADGARPAFDPAGLTGLGLAPGTRLLAGAGARRAAIHVPIALLVDAEGGYLGHHEKRVLVPAGERVPFLAWLPDGLADLVVAGIEATMGAKPIDAAPGRFRPPLETTTGVPFAAMVCYDNAFPGIASEYVAAGARVLFVLSNESWYLGGAEREQLLAMAVLRALETGTPVVRCTTDGLTAVIGPRGQISARLADLPAARAPGPRILRAAVTAGPGRLPPMAWLRGVLPWLVLASLAIPLLHRLRSWARLLAVRPGAGDAASSTPPRKDRSQSGS